MIRNSSKSQSSNVNPLADSSVKTSYYLETYGCQMNTSDSELIRGLLSENYTEAPEE